MDTQGPINEATGMETAPAEDGFSLLMEKKKIDPATLAAHFPEVDARWRQLFSQTGESSFLALIRNEINAVRRQVQGLPLQRRADPPTPYYKTTHPE